jgi:AAA15 family ATPase/GTPase
MASNRIVKHIDRLLLDPNNYRFIDRADYKPVPVEQVADDRIQLRTLNFILGKNQDNVKDLISSFTTNGFLDIDQIQVKPVGDKYLVLEGNRRTATLKYLFDEFKKGNDVGELTEADFKSVNLVEIINENPVQHLITMGLHHISGKKRWSAVNEAQLLSDLIEKYHLTEDEVCEKLGITKQALRRNTRTLSLIQQYKMSDYGDQFKTEMYSIFEKVIGTPPIRSWIGWDNEDYTAYNEVNLDRLFSWISRTEETQEESDGNRKDTKISDPIITQYRQISEIANFINDENALSKMEESRSIAEGYAFSQSVGEAKLRGALETIKSATQLAYNFRDLITSSDYEELTKSKDKIENLLPISKALFFINEKKAQLHFTEISSHFSDATIKKYRKLENVTIKNINRVNIFAGGNNKGKTTILEAFYLLSQLNDLPSYIELERYRGKFLEDFPAKWVDKNFISSIDLKAIFNTKETGLLIKKEATEEDMDKTGYLNSLVAEAYVGNTNLNSNIHLFSNKEPEYRYTKSQILCQSAFTSPYRYNEKLLYTAHKLAIENRYFDKVIQFIKANLDDTIEKIDLVNDEGENRFRVTSTSVEKAIDITKYGEGLQRVFEIALLLGYCKNGVLCIDEIDSALHKSLLIKFTEFIQQIAKEFNVQVFLSTHSKECIDAFVENSFPDDELTAYALEENAEGKIECNFLLGNKLKQLVETINIDIR